MTSETISNAVQANEVSFGELLQQYVREVLREELAGEQRLQERIRDLEASGHRIVDGGQTGQSSWEISDWRTGEVIEAGTGGHDEYDKATERLDPDAMWLHIDHISGGDATTSQTASDNIPESLAEALTEWVCSLSTPDVDVAAVTGWTVDEVHRHRA